MHPLKNTVLAHKAVYSDEKDRMLERELQCREADRKSDDLWLYLFKYVGRAPLIYIYYRHSLQKPKPHLVHLLPVMVLSQNPHFIFIPVITD